MEYFLQAGSCSFNYFWYPKLWKQFLCVLYKNVQQFECLPFCRNHMKLNNIRRDWRQQMPSWRSFQTMEVKWTLLSFLGLLPIVVCCKLAIGVAVGSSTKFLTDFITDIRISVPNRMRCWIIWLYLFIVKFFFMKKNDETNTWEVYKKRVQWEYLHLILVKIRRQINKILQKSMYTCAT